jgi:hypothetical protein
MLGCIGRFIRICRREHAHGKLSIAPGMLVGRSLHEGLSYCRSDTRGRTREALPIQPKAAVICAFY